MEATRNPFRLAVAATVALGVSTLGLHAEPKTTMMHQWEQGSEAAAIAKLGVILDGGDGTVLPLQPDRTRGLAPVQKVTFGVRPEHFHPVGDRRAERRGGQSGFVAVKVTLVEPAGSETILMARLAGQAVTIACEPDDTPPVGTDCALAIDMTKVCLFDQTSGSCL